MSELELVVNASPWIFLGKLESLDLFLTAGVRVSMPHAVLSEIRAGLPYSAGNRASELPSWLQVLDDVTVPLEIAAWDLGAGESQVLARAAEQTRRVAVLDDLQARRCAGILGFPVVGTLGIVLNAKRKGVITLARPLIDRLLRTGLFLSQDLVRSALAEVGE